MNNQILLGDGKTAQQLAEEYSLKVVQIKDENIVWAFEAGHGSRDAEIGKLVEALEKIHESAKHYHDRSINMSNRLDGRYFVTLAEEALKPYQKEEGK